MTSPTAPTPAKKSPTQKVRDEDVVIKVATAKFEQELAFIRESGVHTQIEQLVRPATFDTAKTTMGRVLARPESAEPAAPGRTAGLGRPRVLPVDVFLTATLIAISMGKAHLTDIHRMLTLGLARSYRIQLGITTPAYRVDNDKSITIRQVRYLFGAIAKRLDTNPARQPNLDQDEQADRRTVLEAISDRILAATMAADLPPATTYAADASALQTWARGKNRPADLKTDSKKSKKRSKKGKAGKKEAKKSDSEADSGAYIDDVGCAYDTEAEWAHRTRTYDNGTKFFFGFQAVAICRTGQGLDLVERLRLAPGTTNGVPEAIAMIQAWQEERLQSGQPAIENLLADRGFTYAVPENWAGPLRDLGVAQIMDIHPKDHGVKAYKNVKMIDGKPYHPAIPKELWTIARPRILSPTLVENADPEEKRTHAKNVKALAKFQKLMKERAVYELRRVAGPDANGKERYEFPCCAGKLRDSNCPFSMNLPDDVPLIEYPKTVMPPEHVRTITIPGDVQQKLRQHLTWGSPDWIKAYSKRTAIEGQFGNWKNTATEHVKRGWIRVIGLVKTALMLTLAAASANLRQLRGWADTNNNCTEPKTVPLPKNYGHEELDCYGNIAYAPGYQPLAPPGTE